MKIAIDIGYGDTKIVYKSGDTLKQIKFPSAIEDLGFNATNFGSKMENEYEFEGFNYRVGEATFNALDTRTFNFLIEYAPLLTYHAIQLIKKEIPDIKYDEIELYTGLSIFNWDKHQEFIKRLKEFVVNNEVVRFKKIKLFAQGQGVYLDCKNETNPQNETMVVDVGYNTLDVLVFKDNKPIKNLCYGVEFGIYKIITELKNLLDNEFKTNLSEQKVKQAFIDKKITLGGKEIKLEDKINKLKTKYTKNLINSLYAKSKNTLLEADKVILSGGGAYYLDKGSFYENMIFSKNPYEFSNARGYHNG